MTSDNHVTGPVTEAMERVLRVEAEYWASFRENRAPVIGPRDLRAVLDAAIVTMKSKEQASVHSPQSSEAVELALETLKHARELVEKLGGDFPDAEQKSNGEWASYRDEFDAAIAALQHPAKEKGE